MKKKIINKVQVFKSKSFSNPLGDITKLLTNDDKFFSKFGEAYISKINFKKIKGWKFHKLNNLNLFVISGEVHFVFIDINKKLHKALVVSSKDAKRIFVPSGFYFAFRGISKKENTILNIMDKKYNKFESMDIPINDIFYTWK
jgi:dTDP-4-dehydrorhamnose 3,5-epimerase